jgi:integrase
LPLRPVCDGGELVGLLGEHADLKKRIAHLPQTKNGESREVPLSHRATAALKVLAERATSAAGDFAQNSAQKQRRCRSAHFGY